MEGHKLVINHTVLHVGDGGKWAPPALLGTNSHFDWRQGANPKAAQSQLSQAGEQGTGREPSGWETM